MYLSIILIFLKRYFSMFELIFKIALYFSIISIEFYIKNNKMFDYNNIFNITKIINLIYIFEKNDIKLKKI